MLRRNTSLLAVFLLVCGHGELAVAAAAPDRSPVTALTPNSLSKQSAGRDAHRDAKDYESDAR